MNSISFKDFNIKPGLVSCQYVDSSNNSGTLKFELSKPIIPRNDLIALSLSTLCGQAYQAILMKLGISKHTKKNIEHFTKANLETDIFEEMTVIKNDRRNITLNFSGGFDSLAALAIMPRNTKLVSMDFGGPFTREMSFINRFDTVICKNNIIETNFRKNSQTFMGIGSVLFRDYLQTNINTFGNILGTSVMSNTKLAASNTNPCPLKAAGMENVSYVMSLTEAGTAKIAMQSYPTLIKDSLNSLANPGEEKRHRKQLLAQVIMRRHGLNIEIEEVPIPSKPRFSWGENFQADFITLYLIKHLDKGTKLTVGNIPAEVLSLVKELSLNFYERVNTNFLVNIPEDLRGNLLKSLNKHGMLPYTENDWIEFNKVRNMLKQYYKII